MPEPEKRELDFSPYPLINNALRTAFNNYYQFHIQCGGFLTSCLQGNINSYLLADSENEKPETYRQILWFMHNELPGDCHGSVEKFLEHLSKRRVK